MTTRKTIALTIQTSVGKVIPLIFKKIAYSPDIEHIDMNDHKLFSLRAEVEQGLLDDRHLSAFGRIVHHHMLACLEEITKNVAVGLPADKAPAGHIVVVYKRLIHSYRFL